MIIISYIFKIDFDLFRFAVVFTTGYISLRLLYNISKPFNLLRKILVIGCFILFYTILFIFKDLILINVIKPWVFVLSIVIILANNYIIDFFQVIYDNIIKVFYNFKQRKRGANYET